MTHDLFRSFIETLGATIEKIEVVDIRDNVFYALITLDPWRKPCYHRCAAIGCHCHRAAHEVFHLCGKPRDKRRHPRVDSQGKCRQRSWWGSSRTPKSSRRSSRR
ncbi:MAG: bifunctional nuclease family protein [Desulfobacterales bacterium]|nr:bifunctional nuclease family protein [Desulfobacterales bacterium]